MKIAILYIALGRYAIFWKDFFKSAEKNFLPGIPKDYFVFTDSQKLPFEKKKMSLKYFKRSWDGPMIQLNASAYF